MRQSQFVVKVGQKLGTLDQTHAFFFSQSCPEVWWWSVTAPCMRESMAYLIELALSGLLVSVLPVRGQHT